MESTSNKIILHSTIISMGHSSDFAFQVYPSYIVKNGKIDFSQKGLARFFSNSGFKML